MGERLEPNTNDLLRAPFAGREALVGDEEACRQEISVPRRGLNWTEILNKAGLEAPGYQETALAMKKNRRKDEEKSAGKSK